MEKCKIYIHGRPLGHDVWPSTEGNNTVSQYLSSFLDSNIGSDVKAHLMIDSIDGNTFYSYVHRQNVWEYNCNRQSAYFAITVCLRGITCKDISKLFDLLDLIYKQKCLNYLIRQDNNKEFFLIKQFKDVEDLIQKNIVSIIERNFEGIMASSFEIQKESIDTSSSKIKRYSLSDVNSPTFFKDAKNYTLVVSPDFLSIEDNISKIKDDMSSCKQELSSCKQELSSCKQELSSCKQENSVLSEKCKQLEKNVELWKSKTNEGTSDYISIQDENHKIKEENKALKDKIKELQGNSQTLKQDDKVFKIFAQATRNMKKSDWFLTLIFIILCCCLFGIFRIERTYTETFGNGNDILNDTTNTTDIKSPLQQILKTVNYLEIKEMFRDAKNANNQNINIVNGGPTINIDHPYNIELTDSSLIEGLDPSLGEWCIEGFSASINKDTLTAHESKKTFLIVFKYNGVKVLHRSITTQ